MIETWDAVRLDKLIRTGRTRPLIIECVRHGDSGQKAERRSMVVKAFKLPEVTLSGLFCEIIGNLLARDFGIDTPEPGLINLSEKFTASANSVLRGHSLQLLPGIGVGCEQLPKGFTSPVVGASLNPEELAQAALIYGYDLIVQNPDRYAKNPNCLMGGGRIVAIDFNLAFSFIFPVIGGLREPWKLSQLRFRDEHLFRRPLRNQQIDWKPLRVAVEALARTRIESWARALPATWQEWTGSVCDHLTTIKEHAAELEIELQRSLA